jgi:hypothetical protein
MPWRQYHGKIKKRKRVRMKAVCVFVHQEWPGTKTERAKHFINCKKKIRERKIEVILAY